MPNAYNLKLSKADICTDTTAKWSLSLMAAAALEAINSPKATSNQRGLASLILPQASLKSIRVKMKYMAKAVRLALRSWVSTFLSQGFFTSDLSNLIGFFILGLIIGSHQHLCDDTYSHKLNPSDRK